MTASRRPSGLFYLILGGNAPKYEAGFLAKCWVPMLRNTHKSLEDYKHEGDMQHHCVYSNSYYGKKGSLILSARLLESPTTPLETVEISLSNWKILQCYGKFNEPTEYHKQIMSLVNKNVYRFKQIN